MSLPYQKILDEVIILQLNAGEVFKKTTMIREVLEAEISPKINTIEEGVSMDINNFPVELKDIGPMIVTMLTDISARQFAMQQFILQEKAEKSGEDFESIKNYFDEIVAFHNVEVCRKLYESFSSIRDLLPPEM